MSEDHMLLHRIKPVYFKCKGIQSFDPIKVLFLPLSEVFEYRLEHVSKEISDEERTKEQRVLSEVAHHEVVVMCRPPSYTHIPVHILSGSH